MLPSKSELGLDSQCRAPFLWRPCVSLGWMELGTAGREASEKGCQCPEALVPAPLCALGALGTGGSPLTAGCAL